MVPENPTFLVRGDDGQEYGPVDLGELRGWVRENRAGLGTEVRVDESGSAWQSWQDYPELVALLAEVNVTGAVPGMPPLPGVAIAPVWRRLVAWMMDVFVVAILLSSLEIPLDRILPMQEILQAMANPATLESLPTPMFNQVMAFVIIDNACLVLYFSFCHAMYGMTPAKMLLRIKVIDPSGQKPVPIKAFIRAMALVLSVNLIFPLVWAFLNPQRRTLHDLVADTCVVNS